MISDAGKRTQTSLQYRYHRHSWEAINVIMTDVSGRNHEKVNYLNSANTNCHERRLIIVYAEVQCTVHYACPLTALEWFTDQMTYVRREHSYVIRRCSANYRMRLVTGMVPVPLSQSV